MNPILCFCQEFYIHVLAREYNNQDLKVSTKAHLIHVLCCQIKYILTYSCTVVSWSRCSLSFENESFELKISTKLKVTPALTRVLIKILLQWMQPTLLFISIISICVTQLQTSKAPNRDWCWCNFIFSIIVRMYEDGLAHVQSLRESDRMAPQSTQ